jgi:hypothetical protein
MFPNSEVTGFNILRKLKNLKASFLKDNQGILSLVKEYV